MLITVPSLMHVCIVTIVMTSASILQGSVTLCVLLSCLGCDCDAVYTSVGVTPAVVGGERVDEGGAKMTPSTYNAE